MTKLSLYLGSVFLSLSLLGACGEDLPDLESGDLEAFGARLEDLRGTDSIPGMAAAVAQGDQIVWQKGFGFADVENRVRSTPQTFFHLASLTKTFAAAVLMHLVEQGKLDLEDPVSQYGISLSSPGVIRVKHLLTHTSEGEPGSHFLYNGDRYALLDKVILQASGRRFAELLIEQIIRPLQLTQTAPNVLSPADFELTQYDRTQWMSNLAQGYSSDGRTRIAYPSHFSSAAGLISSVTDFVRYSNALDRNQLVSAETLARMFTPTISNSGEPLAHGLGWFIRDENGTKLVWHYGFWVANSSLVVKVPDQGLTFILLANSDMLSRPYGLGLDDDVLRSPYARAFVDVFVNPN